MVTVIGVRFRTAGKIYYFSMNGQTGKVYGELPIDYKKISLVSGIVSLVTLVILLLGGLA